MDQGVSKLMENSEMSLENLCCNCSSAFLLSTRSGTLQEGSLSVASAHEHGLVEILCGKWRMHGPGSRLWERRKFLRTVS